MKTLEKIPCLGYCVSLFYPISLYYQKKEIMKTALPNNITTIEEAKNFLTQLSKNGEAFHPDDDANDIIWENCQPTPEECEQLNKLMEQVCSLDFDVYEFILSNL